MFGYATGMADDPVPETEGQLSEVTHLDPASAKDPVSDGDHVAGSPEAESGEVDEGLEVGPDARVTDEHHQRGRQ